MRRRKKRVCKEKGTEHYAGKGGGDWEGKKRSLKKKEAEKKLPTARVFCNTATERKKLRLLQERRAGTRKGGGMLGGKGARDLPIDELGGRSMPRGEKEPGPSREEIEWLGERKVPTVRRKEHFSQTKGRRHRGEMKGPEKGNLFPRNISGCLQLDAKGGGLMNPRLGEKSLPTL